MAKPIHFFLGSDDYTSLTTLAAWKRAFVAKHDAAAVVTVEMADEEEGRRQLIEASQTQSLFATAKLIVVKDFLTVTDPKTITVLTDLWGQAKINELVVLNWQRGEPDKRRAIYKKMLLLVKKGAAGLQQFSVPEGNSRAVWLRDWLQKKSIVISQEALDFIINTLGHASLWQLANIGEILATVAEGEIDLKLARQYVIEESVLENFGVTDLVIRGRRADSLAALAPLTLSRGVAIEESISLFGALVWLIRSACLLQTLREQGVGERDLARTAEINPYAASKMLPYLGQRSAVEWQKTLVWAGELDLAAKSGQSDLVTACEELVWSLTNPL